MKKELYASPRCERGGEVYSILIVLESSRRHGPEPEIPLGTCQAQIQKSSIETCLSPSTLGSCRKTRPVDDEFTSKQY